MIRGYQESLDLETGSKNFSVKQTHLTLEDPSPTLAFGPVTVRLAALLTSGYYLECTGLVKPNLHYSHKIQLKSVESNSLSYKLGKVTLKTLLTSEGSLAHCLEAYARRKQFVRCELVERVEAPKLRRLKDAPNPLIGNRLLSELLEEALGSF